eukprot:COSAG02_NODE_1306_length_13342_cov_5.305822_5_plen_73_part_00
MSSADEEFLVSRRRRLWHSRRTVSSRPAMRALRKLVGGIRHTLVITSTVLEFRVKLHHILATSRYDKRVAEF